MKPRIYLLLFPLMSLFLTHALAQEQAGHYERITVHGKSLEANLDGDPADRDVSVYLPPGYARNTGQRYPVLYLLHGFTDSDDRWFGLLGQHFVHVPSAVDAAFAGGAKELIVVMPNAFTKFQGSMYSNSVTIGDWEAFVAEDLVEYIDSHYRTLAVRGSRGLAGHSMGGYGVLRIGMKYPQVFSSLYSMSPCCMAANLSPDAGSMAEVEKVVTAEEIQQAGFGVKAMLASAAAWSPNPKNPPHFFDLPVAGGELRQEVIATWAANAPLAMVHQYIPALRQYRAIAIDAGDKDAGIAPTVVSLDGILSGYGINHDFEIYEGDHVSRIDERLEQKVLPFFSKHLDF